MRRTYDKAQDIAALVRQREQLIKAAKHFAWNRGAERVGVLLVSGRMRDPEVLDKLPVGTDAKQLPAVATNVEFDDDTFTDILQAAFASIDRQLNDLGVTPPEINLRYDYAEGKHDEDRS